MRQSSFLLIILSIIAGSSRAQSLGPSAIDAGGNSATVAGTNHEYAIGQVVSGASYSSPSLIVTQGVLQPVFNATPVYEIITASELEIFPNPVENILYLQPSFAGGGSLRYGFYDAAGKLVRDRTIALSSGKERQSLDLSGLAAGQYFLEVTWTQSASVHSSGYKIQKLH